MSEIISMKNWEITSTGCLIGTVMVKHQDAWRAIIENGKSLTVKTSRIQEIDYDGDPIVKTRNNKYRLVGPSRADMIKGFDNA